MVAQNKARKILMVSSPYITSASRIPDQEIGDYRIITGEYQPGMYNMLDADSYFYVTQTIHIKRLQQKVNNTWYDWMTDDPQHWFSMAELALRARGKVLTSGLGLGLINYHLAYNLQVESVDTVERSKEIIDMAGAYVQHSPMPGAIYQGDFFRSLYFFKNNDIQYDTIIVDFWGNPEGQQDEAQNNSVFLEAKKLCEELYPDALHLYHGYQNTVDIDRFIAEVDKNNAKI